MLGGQFLERWVGHWFDDGDFFIGVLHRISNYLKIVASQQCLQFYQMDSLSLLPVDEKARCLAVHRVKAKLIKDTFINQGSIDRQDVVARQVIKYSTLLSEKMLHTIKTEELRQFEKDVKDYCRISQKNVQITKPKKAPIKQLNLSQYLSNFKNSTKVRLLSIHRKRNKTSQGYDLTIKPASISSDPQTQNKIESPLANHRIREAIEHNKRKIMPANRFHLKGKAVNSQIIQLLEKLDQAESIEKLKNRRECLNQEDQQYLHGRATHLKQEKQRLTTAFQNQERAKFKPMGRIKKDHKGSCDKTGRKIHQQHPNKNLQSTGSRLMLQPIKKSSVATSSNYVGQASIHFQQGLPLPIRNQITTKKIKKHQTYMATDQHQRHQHSNQNTTPCLLHSNNIFASTNFI